MKATAMFVLSWFFGWVIMASFMLHTGGDPVEFVSSNPWFLAESFGLYAAIIGPILYKYRDL